MNSSSHTVIISVLPTRKGEGRNVNLLKPKVWELNQELICFSLQLKQLDLSKIEKWQEYVKSCRNAIVMNPAKVSNTIR